VPAFSDGSMGVEGSGVLEEVGALCARHGIAQKVIRDSLVCTKEEPTVKAGTNWVGGSDGKGTRCS